jgi:quercetin dioxygenase-like cupin family protein
MPIMRDADAAGFERAPGVTLKVLTDGDRMMLMDVHLEAGSCVTMHTHPHEQTGRLISGKLKFEIGEETFELNPGDAWMIPGDVPHEATALEECHIVEVFSPPREDYRGR